MRLFYSLLATAVVAGAGWGVLSVSARLPDKVQDAIVAPGRALGERFDDEYRRLRKKGRKAVKNAEEKFEDAGLEIDLSPKEKAYSLGAWAGVGFVLCLLMSALLGVSSILTALKLGFKVTLTLVFLQGALIFGGVLALSGGR